MSKSLVDKLIREFLTNPRYKRRWDTVLRSHMGGFPHITTINKEDLVTLYRNNTIAALYNTPALKEMNESAEQISLIEQAAVGAAEVVFNNFETYYAKTRGRRKGTVIRDGNSIIIRQPQGLHSSIRNIISKKGWEAMSNSPAFKGKVRKKLKTGDTLAVFNRRSQVLHEDKTTVGSFTLAKLYQGLLDKVVESDFTPAQTAVIARSIGEYYGDIIGTWKKQTNIQEFSLSDTLEIPLTIGSIETNKAGSEEYDWKQIRKKLEDILAEECLRGTFGQDYMSTGGSKPLTVRAQERALHIVTKKIKDQLKSSKSISVTTTKLPKEETSKGSTGTAKIAGKAVSKKRTKVARKGYPRVAKAQKTAKSPVALLALINQALPNTLVKNMGAPRLVNRTGRFAQSVRAIDITTTRGGYPSIGYTYEKDPYQVFESTSGTRFSSRERDPRVLIDQSIREIAATLMVGRLYTRRV